MMSFSHPAFARLSPKIDRAVKELGEVQAFMEQQAGPLQEGQWGAVSAVSLGIHNIYNGIEDIMLSLAKDVDGLAPSGATMHQDILDQMSAGIAGARPALLDQYLYAALSELKGFRHLVRHRYGFDLKADKVQDNLERAMKTLPEFIEAVVALERALV